MELKRIRTQKGLSQADVANGIDVSTTVYARYERGEREPSIEMLLRLSQFFDAPVDYLLGNKDTALSSFTKYELDLIMASRAADERAKEDALNMLPSHPAKREKALYA